METLTCRFSKRFAARSIFWFLIPLIVTQVAFWKVFVGAESSQRTHNLMWTAAAGALFTCLIIFAVRQMWKKEPYILVDRQGIHFPASGFPVILWPEIYQMRRRIDIWGHRYIDLFIREEEEYVRKLNGWRWLQFKLTRRIGDPVSIVISSLDVPPEEIYKILQSHLPPSNSASPQV